MATDAPRGFKLRDDLMNYKPKLRRYYIPVGDGTAVFPGDLVKTAGEVDASGHMGVIQAAASNAPVGVVVSVDQVDGISDANFSLYRKHRIASTKMYCLVCDDPNALYECQEDSDAGNIALTDAGLNVNFIVAAGDTTFGLSGMEIDSSTVNTTATLPLKLMGSIQEAGSDVPDTNAKWVVKINNHQYGSHTGTVGVA